MAPAGRHGETPTAEPATDQTSLASGFSNTEMLLSLTGLLQTFCIYRRYGRNVRMPSRRSRKMRRSRFKLCRTVRDESAHGFLPLQCQTARGAPVLQDVIVSRHDLQPQKVMQGQLSIQNAMDISAARDF